MLLLLSTLNASGQMITNTAFYRNLPAVRSARVHYENDFFSGSDQYYTQGINLEFINPALVKSPLNKALPKFQHGENKFGVALEHVGFTPSTISSDEISYGDRPFASALLTKSFRISNDSMKQRRISSCISLGVIGPLAGGAEFQKAIHRWINGTPPQGWRNQIGNDPVLNYSFEYVKGIATRRRFALAANAELRLGTLHTRSQAGLILMVGIFENPWNSFTVSKRKVQFYLFEHPQIILTGYDATLQGGVFNHHSPYTLSANDVERLVFQNNAGLIISIKKLHFEYFQSLLTKEFTQGKSHFYGSVRIGVLLD